MAAEVSPSKRANSRGKANGTPATVNGKGEIAVRKSEARSRVTNGRDVLPNVDGRSLVARRYRDIASAILADQGGVEQCSESRQQLIRRFAAAAVIAEQMEADLANGKSISIQEHALLCSTLVRVARQIGVNRIPKNVTPTLSDYLEELKKRDTSANSVTADIHNSDDTVEAAE